jgi:hypothetical protein
MKKQLFTLLTIASLASTTVSTTHAGAVTKGLNGTLQIIKIAGGLAITAGGIILFTLPCSMGCLLGIVGDNAESNSGELTSLIKTQINTGLKDGNIKLSAQEKKLLNKNLDVSIKTAGNMGKKGGYCCMATGAIAGIPTTIGGILLTKSGIIGLKKLIQGKDKEKEVAL